MNTEDRSSMIEDALRGFLARRCKRAYVHDMRNGLQGIQAGLDALARAARPGKPLSLPLEQLQQFVQQALTNHERGLDRVLDGIASEDNAVAPVPLREFLLELIRFITTDAARNRVRIKFDAPGDDVIAAIAPAKLRLILLGLLTNAIDTLSGGGDVTISARIVGTNVQIDVVDVRVACDVNAFVITAVDEVVAHSGGAIERNHAAETGYRVRLTFPRGTLPS